MTEIWKDVLGYEGLYKVSNFGNVKSLDRSPSKKAVGFRKFKGKVISKKLSATGYIHFCLCKNGEQKSISGHRLVALAFIPNPKNKPQVNHINEIKTDNMVENLEWCTNKENMNHGTARARRNEKIYKKIYQYTLDNKLVSTYKCAKEACKDKITRAGISAVCLGKRKFHKGFIWSYVRLH